MHNVQKVGRFSTIFENDTLISATIARIASLQYALPLRHWMNYTMNILFIKDSNGYIFLSS